MAHEQTPLDDKEDSPVLQEDGVLGMVGGEK